MKVLFAATPAIGHVNPLLVAARILQNAGHETALYTGTHFAEDRVCETTVLSVMGGCRLRRAKYGCRFSGTQAICAWTGETALRHEEDLPRYHALSVQGTPKDAARVPADLVVHETTFCGVLPLLLGHRSSRPWGAASWHHDTATAARRWLALRSGFAPAKDAAQREQYREIARNMAHAVSNPVREHANRLLSNLGLPGLTAPLLESMATLADVILQPSVPGFEFPLRKPAAQNLHYIGALLPQGSGDEPPQLREAREAGRTVILVSQGTVGNGDLGQLVAPVIQGFGDRSDVLILVTTGGRPIEAIPCALPANTIASQYLNFSKVLPYVDVLVTFGGYGTVTQALHFGVPMVLAGQSEDKPENGARVAWTGSGLYLRTDNPSIPLVRSAVEYILSEPKYRASAQKMALEFRSYNAAREIRYLLGTLVAEGQTVPA